TAQSAAQYATAFARGHDNGYIFSKHKIFNF
ncbi:conserved hypothetical protein, partial [Trichinella spiralis]